MEIFKPNTHSCKLSIEWHREIGVKDLKLLKFYENYAFFKLLYAIKTTNGYLYEAWVGSLRVADY